MKKIMHCYKETLLLLCFSLSFFHSFCQNTYLKCHPCATKCEILQHIITDSVLVRFFNLKRYADSPIVIVDVNNFFSNCSIGNVAGRSISVVHDSLLINQTNNLNYVVYTVFSGKAKYIIDIYHKKTHGLGWIKLEKRHGKFFSVESSLGVMD